MEVRFPVFSVKTELYGFSALTIGNFGKGLQSKKSSLKSHRDHGPPVALLDRLLFILSRLCVSSGSMGMACLVLSGDTGNLCFC